jgi:hypothetical protein
MLRSKHRLGFAALATAGVLALAATAAHAAPITGQLTVANANLATQGPGTLCELYNY